MFKILIVEDDKKIAGLLASHLEKYGYQAVQTTDFSAVLAVFEQVQPDLVLLDVNLPKFDGYYWCRQIRLLSRCPILFLSARDGKMDQVMALENGADDYITKPFHYEVVLAKINSQLRRAYGSYASVQKEQTVAADGLQLFPERLKLSFDERSVELAAKEALLLQTLLERRDRVVSRDLLLSQLWDDGVYVDDNTLNVYITRVRKKLKELGIENAIETVRGNGYLLRVNWTAGV
ncbi:OmpR family two-component system response regulator YxdJ [Tumebacillus sp. BK434]|uniref:response regulator transcription factor n=1 Tax=Tumebacillus sp. BK434 TaxID=2512169 RepID=UPI00104F45BD|nr:response regulator transcription factor [Tumebacillus sp. BK434]TCP57962.1 OmpR family two-component system response regulator YxdJ [Tumebacillus sp. BK434]